MINKTNKISKPYIQNIIKKWQVLTYKLHWLKIFMMHLYKLNQEKQNRVKFLNLIKFIKMWVEVNQILR